MRVAVLVSGSGSNLQAILDAAAADDDFGAEIVVVISDRHGVGALGKAAAAGVLSEVVTWSDHRDREAFTSALCDAAERHGAAGLVLAGFMRILAPVAVRRYPSAILNVHPALLPAFPGAHAVPLALQHGVTVTGATVHFVDEQVDHGPIISQEAVPVLPGDDEASLHARIQLVEHRLYPEAVKAFAHGRLQVVGRRVVWREKEES
jgi:phosphoribosylglycinamide formyltransferase-1